MDSIIQNISKDFNNKIKVEEKRTGIYQLFLPIYHEDGDMIDIFISHSEKENTYSLCDYGLTLQRLAYTFDIDTPNKEAILKRIVDENGLEEKDGNICINTKPETVFNDIMQITQAYAKIGSMKYFKREVIQSLFFEDLHNFIFEELKEFKPKENVYPFPKRTELQADYEFSPNGHPVYLFGIKDVDRARLATITCLELQIKMQQAVSCSVYQDFDGIPKKDRLRLTNACDKQFTSLDEFISSSKTYLERQR